MGSDTAERKGNAKGMQSSPAGARAAQQLSHQAEPAEPPWAMPGNQGTQPCGCRGSAPFGSQLCTAQRGSQRSG